MKKSLIIALLGSFLVASSALLAADAKDTKSCAEQKDCKAQKCEQASDKKCDGCKSDKKCDGCKGEKKAASDEKKAEQKQ